MRILHLEDSRLDARLVEFHLRASFPDAVLVVAGDRAAYEEALRRGKWDLVLSDFMVPDFSGLEALHMARSTEPDIPFILVTGAIGEEAAVETLRAGATDFLLKTRLQRLAPVIYRAIEENWKQRERRASLEALGERVTSYRALANNLPHLLARFDRELRFIFANRIWQEALGRGEEECLGMTLEGLGVDGARRGPFESLVLRAFRQKGAQEAVMASPLDPAMRLDVRVVPEPDASGGVGSVLVVARDVTRELETLTQLQSREETYRATFEHSLLVAWMVDSEQGTILEANAAAADFYGYPREAFKGMPIAHLTTMGEAGRQANLERLRKGESLQFEAQHRLEDGTLRDVLVFATPLPQLDRPLAFVVCHDITLRKSLETRFKDAQRMARMGDWAMDLRTQRATVSENLCRIYGFEPDQYPKDHEGFLNLVHPEDRARFEAQIQAFMAGDVDRKEFEFRAVRPDGSTCHLHTYAELMLDSEGLPAVLKGTDLDVTERVVAERERDEPRHHLNLLREALEKAAIWAITDRKGTITYANDMFCEVSGYSREELVGQNHRILKSGRHPKAFYEELWRTISHGQIWHGIICNRAKNGSSYWVDSTIVPFSRPGLPPEEYLAIRFLVTDRVEAEAALARVAEERRGLLEANLIAKAVPFSEQADGSLRFGPTAEGVLGLAPEECPRHPADLAGLLEEGYRGILDEALAQASPDSAGGFEAPFMKHGEARWIRWTLGRSEGRLRGVIQDITEVHLFQEQLLQSQKLESLGTLVGGIAHDFNNLLMAILGYVEVLQETSGGAEETARGLQTIHRAASRGRTLVSELMNFSRRHAPSRVPTDLNPLVEEVSRLLTRALPASIHLHLDQDLGLPTVLADPSQVHQVIMNLALNARDAIPGEGHITLRTGRTDVGQAEAEALGKRPGPYLVIEVEDTGSGMAPEVAARIFEPFFTTKPAGKGTGLGLSVAYGIVESHGGILRCKSEWAKGTTFSALLPLGVEGAEEGTSLSTLGARIAVLDAPGAEREALAHLLSELGHAPIAFDTPAALVASHLESPFQLLILHPEAMELGHSLPDLLRREGLGCAMIVAAGDPTGLRPLPGSVALLHHPYRPYELLSALGRFLS